MIQELIMNNPKVLEYWTLYNIISIPVILVALQILPIRLKRGYFLLSFIFFYMLAISMVGYGLLIAVTLILILYKTKFRRREPIISDSLELPDFQQSPQPSDNTLFGEGSGFKTNQANIGQQVRKKILIAVNQFSSSTVNRINQLALSDNIDEIRLYAHSLLEKQERNLSAQIMHFINKLNHSRDPRAIALLEKQIALLFWEQIYKSFSTELNTSLIEKIKSYATRAFEELPDDIELPLLLSKVALHETEYERAKYWINIAIENQAPLYKAIVPLVLIAYKEKNYVEVMRLLKEESTQDILSLQPYIKFWVNHD